MLCGVTSWNEYYDVDWNVLTSSSSMLSLQLCAPLYAILIILYYPAVSFFVSFRLLFVFGFLFVCLILFLFVLSVGEGVTIHHPVNQLMSTTA